MSQPPDKEERRPRRRDGAPDDAHGGGTRASVTDVAGSVVDMAGWRERRAWQDTLDWLDAHGLCACWVLPRPHPHRRDSAS